MSRDPYAGPKPTQPNQPAAKGGPRADMPEERANAETRVICPTCRGKATISVLEAAALESEAKRRDACICQ